MKTKIIKIKDILVDKETYPRQNPDFVTIARYMNALNSGAKFPPITVGELQGKYYLIDGLHRIKSRTALKLDSIEVEIVKVKDKHEIYKLAVIANISHGRQFSTQEVAQICITLEAWNMSKAEIQEIVRIPADKLTAFVAKRAVNIFSSTNPQDNKQLAIKSQLRNLAGSQQSAGFESEQEELGPSRTQIRMIDTLITMLENNWLDMKDRDVFNGLIKLKGLLDVLDLKVVKKVITPKVKA